MDSCRGASATHCHKERKQSKRCEGNIIKKRCKNHFPATQDWAGHPGKTFIKVPRSEKFLDQLIHRRQKKSRLLLAMLIIEGADLVQGGYGKIPPGPAFVEIPGGVCLPTNKEMNRGQKRLLVRRFDCRRMTGRRGLCWKGWGNSMVWWSWIHDAQALRRLLNYL